MKRLSKSKRQNLKSFPHLKFSRSKTRKDQECYLLMNFKKDFLKKIEYWVLKSKSKRKNDWSMKLNLKRQEWKTKSSFRMQRCDKSRSLDLQLLPSIQLDTTRKWRSWKKIQVCMRMQKMMMISSRLLRMQLLKKRENRKNLIVWRKKSQTLTPTSKWNRKSLVQLKETFNF